MPVEPTPVGGERRFCVTELSRNAGGELVAVRGAADLGGLAVSADIAVGADDVYLLHAQTTAEPPARCKASG